MSASAIEWCDEVWNPVTGCDRVSPGCANCYALQLAPKLRRFAVTRGGGKWADAPDGGRASGPAFGVQLHEAVLGEPLRWRRPRRVFVNSMSDLFHEGVPDEYIDRVFAVMAWANRHTFQVLTKRPERMHAYLAAPEREERVHAAMCSECCFGIGAVYGCCGFPGEDCGLLGVEWPLPNVWMGVSIENRRFVDRADVLRATPAAVRFISAEPLLGSLLPQHVHASDEGYECERTLACAEPATLRWADEARTWRWYCDKHAPGLDLTGIDWLIVGGESGPRARPMRLEWAHLLLAAANAAGVAFFMKQLGGVDEGGAVAMSRWTTARPAIENATNPDGALQQTAEDAVSVNCASLYCIYALRDGDASRARYVAHLSSRGRGRGPQSSELLDLETGETFWISSNEPRWRARRLKVDELPPALAAAWPKHNGRPITPGLQVGPGALRRLAWRRLDLQPAQGALFS